MAYVSYLAFMYMRQDWLETKMSQKNCPKRLFCGIYCFSFVHELLEHVNN